MTTAAIVLAAGAGHRFAGGAKLLASFRGRPLVAWAAAAAVEAGLDETIVVVGETSLTDALPGGLTVVSNADVAGGIATSLRMGVRAASASRHDAVVVGLGDQPLVPATAWAAVAASPSPLAVATYEGRRRNPVRLARSVWPLLPLRGDDGARVLLRARPDLVVDVPCSGDPTDVDTVADLEALVP